MKRNEQLMVLKMELKMVNEVEVIMSKKRKHEEISDSLDEGILDSSDDRRE